MRKSRIELFECVQVNGGANWAALVGYKGESQTAVLIKAVAFNSDRTRAIKNAIKLFRRKEANA